MSEVEETLERIKVQAGVEGYVICSKNGQVLRRLPTMSQAQAETYADFMLGLSKKARSVARSQCLLEPIRACARRRGEPPRR